MIATAQRTTTKLLVLLLVGSLLVVGALIYHQNKEQPLRSTSESTEDRDYWKETLTPEQYAVLREGGTEIPYTGALNNEKRTGTYYSYGCDKPLFRSEQKYDSGTGWPSFYAPVAEDAVVLRKERDPFDDRIDVLDTCGSHLGHVFDDGPAPTGKRFCMNSIAMYFVPDEDKTPQ